MDEQAQARPGGRLNGAGPRARAARGEAWTAQAVARAKEGDRHAVRYLYATHSPAVRRYVLSLVRDQDAADDVVQTTFLKLLTSIHRYEPRDVPFEAWLLRVARNTALDELRRRRADRCAPVLEHDGRVDGGADRSAAVRTALQHVPAAEREVLVLRHLVGLSSAEVAERLGTTVAAVQALHQRGRDSLRAALRRAGDAPVPARQGTGRFTWPGVAAHRPRIEAIS